MSPSEAATGAKRWRYYVSQAILQGCKHAGSLPRISAPPLERAALEAVRAAAPGQKPSDGAIRTGLEKVVAGKTSLTIRWRKAENSDGPPLTLPPLLAESDSAFPQWALLSPDNQFFVPDYAISENANASPSDALATPIKLVPHK
jgi:hypothetical protein